MLSSCVEVLAYEDRHDSLLHLICDLKFSGNVVAVIRCLRHKNHKYRCCFDTVIDRLGVGCRWADVSWRNPARDFTSSFEPGNKFPRHSVIG
jgi:hypothetical protein